MSAEMPDRFKPLIIKNKKLTATLISHGAVLADLRLAGVDFPLVLGFDDYTHHQKHQAFYFGSVIGRYANRIGGGQCQVEGRLLELELNNGSNHLHGGQVGFATKLWAIAEQGEDFIAFMLESPDGDSGYPGHVSVEARYEVAKEATLRLTVTAQSDKATPINIAHHPYFNLDNSADILDHKLEISAATYLPSDENHLPTGEVLDVLSTPYDFRRPRSIRDASQGRDVLFDNTYCLKKEPSDRLVFAARLTGKSGVELEIWTTQVGLHFYEGDQVEDLSKGLGGRENGMRSGLCLETQSWPDSPNQAHFPDSILRPGETYRQVTEYRFKKT